MEQSFKGSNAGQKSKPDPPKTLECFKELIEVELVSPLGPASPPVVKPEVKACQGKELWAPCKNGNVCNRNANGRYPLECQEDVEPVKAKVSAHDSNTDNIISIYSSNKIFAFNLIGAV